MTREAFEKLPKAAQTRIEYLRGKIKTDSRHRELYITKGTGYIEGFRDAGIITDYEHKALKCYLTI